MKLTIDSFGGIAPAIAPEYLSAAQAQVATNTKTFPSVSALAPLKGPSSPIGNLNGGADNLPKTGTIQSIYKWGDDQTTDPAKYWFHWVDDVDVVQGFVFDDPSQRTYFTGDGVPKATDSSLALSGGGTNLPAAARNLGVPKPSSGPTVNTGAEPADAESLVSESRVYTFTWVNSWGEESEPYSAGAMTAQTVTVYPGQSVTVSNFPSVPSGDYNITAKRIYRSVAGTGSTEFLFVAEISAATASYTDTLTGEQLGEVCPSLTWSAPPDDMIGIVPMAYGGLAGFAGREVYLSEPYRPFAFPLGYRQLVEHPIVGLGVMDTTLAVLTRGRPFFIQGGSPEAMVVVEADIPQACVSKRSIVSLNGAVLYASPDGLVRLSPNGSALVTQGLYDRAQWQALNPSSIHAYSHDGKYIAFFGTDGGGFVYDPSAATFNLHDIDASAGYADLVSDTLYLVNAAKQIVRWDQGDTKDYTWRSKRFELPREACFSVCEVEAVDYPVTVAIYRDESLLLTHTVTSRDKAVFRLPPGHGYAWEVELTGAARVFRVALAESVQELANG